MKRSEGIDGTEVLCVTQYSELLSMTFLCSIIYAEVFLTQYTFYNQKDHGSKYARQSS